MEEQKNEKVTPGFVGEWTDIPKTNPKEHSFTIEPKKEYERVDISPPIYLHPLTITFVKDENGISTNIVFKRRLSQKQADEMGKIQRDYRDKLEAIVEKYRVEFIQIVRFNPYAFKDGANPYHIILLAKIPKFVGANAIRQYQIRFTGIYKEFIKC